MDEDKEIVNDVEETLHNDIVHSDFDAHHLHSGGECLELSENVKLVYTDLVDKGLDRIIDNTVSSDYVVVDDVADTNMGDDARVKLHPNSNSEFIMKNNAVVIGAERKYITTHDVSGITSTIDDVSGNTNLINDVPDNAVVISSAIGSDTNANLVVDPSMSAYVYADAGITVDVDADARMTGDIINGVHVNSDADADVVADGHMTPVVDADRGISHDADADVDSDGDMNPDVDADRRITRDVDTDADAHMNADMNVDADLIPEMDADTDTTAAVDADSEMIVDVNGNDNIDANTNAKPDTSSETDADSNIDGDENIDVDAASFGDVTNNQNSVVADFTSNVEHGNCAKNGNNADLWTHAESEGFPNETITEENKKGDGIKIGFSKRDVFPDIETEGTMSRPGFDSRHIKDIKKTFHWEICEDGGSHSGSEDDQLEFMKELESFFKERGLEFKPPKFYGEGINCLKLWRAVAKLGGYDQVTSCKLWRQVGESFKPPKTCTTVSWTFRIFYEKALLEYEKYRMHGGELPLRDPTFEEPLRSVQNQVTTGNNTTSGRAVRDSAVRAMQGWHSQRLLGNGEVGEPIIKDKNSSSTSKREKQMKGFLKRKKSSAIDRLDKAARVKVAKPQLDSAAIDIGPPADWVKVNVQRTKDCFEVYALVPGLLREEVRVQSDPAGRLVITGQPEQVDNPWGVTPFKKVVSLPSRIDPHQTSAVVTLHGQLFVRVPFESPPDT